jgi:hypothetical protein
VEQPEAVHHDIGQYQIRRVLPRNREGGFTVTGLVDFVATLKSCWT